jgi:putative SOS response-associated peptidase YedK
MVELFQLLRLPELQPRYNIAPTQPVAVIRQRGSARELSLMRWGLIPSWAKDPAIGSRMINARAETVATKPSFRAAFKRRRCLIPADGFYEWQKRDGRTKQPFYIGLKDEQPFAFAGLWESWTAADGSEIESCTVITTAANDLLRELHDRMPVILDEDDYPRWLDPKPVSADNLQSLLHPFPSERMRFYPVNTVVNSPQNEVPQCIQRAGTQGTLFEE